MHPRWVLDPSTVFDFGFDRYLREFTDNLSEIREKYPQVLEVSQYDDAWDRPFIFLPPCWDEMRVGLQILRDHNHEFAEEMESTLHMLHKLVEMNLMTAETEDTMKGFEGERAERKLRWLKVVKERLKPKKKKVAFLTENPMLLMRTSIAGIMNGTGEEKLYGNVPQQPMEIWTDKLRAKENVLMVDRQFLTSSVGEQLSFYFQTYHAAASKSFRVFLTTDTQRFAQAYQLKQNINSNYPFCFCEPEKIRDLDHIKSSGMSLVCRLTGLW